jgi:two-component system, NtrC family, sensor kinase
MPTKQQAVNLLVVDDDVQIRKLLKKVTEAQGYRCTAAPSAEKARELMAAQPFDILITDIQMPGESGLDLIRFVNQAYPQSATIVISVINDPQEAKSILDLGVCGYITKPFERHQALITIKNALMRRKLEMETLNRNRDLELAVRHRTNDYAALVDELTTAKAKVAGSVQYHKDQLIFMQTLLDAIPNPIFFKDAEGIYQGCNHAFEEFIGHDRDEIIGRTVFDIAPKELADMYYAKDQELINQPGKQTYEGRVRYADGSIRDVFLNKATYTDSSGRVGGMVGVMIDISQRIQKENALRISEEKNRKMLDNIGLGVALISPRMEIMEMNTMMQQWFPDVKADGVAVCYESFSDPPRHMPCGPCPAKKTLEDGQAHEAIVHRQCTKGDRDLKIISSAILDKDGRVIAAIELVKDITDEIAMERELQQSQKMASIGQLAAGVAHEINNPTGFVSSNLNSLQDYLSDLDRLIGQYRAFKKSVDDKDIILELNPAGRDMLQRIENTEKEIDIEYIRQDIEDLIGECMQGTERIKKIVQDLKHFAHPGQDKVQDTDINRELESTLNVVNNELKYKATVAKNFNPLPVIQANPQQLNQVFVNILVNAAQAIENKGEICVCTQALNGHVQISISDNGCGIAPGNITRIFDPFFTTKEIGKGTGLGMNIAYNIIKKHNGTIEVQSEVGKGTVFTIKLPAETSS